MSSQSQYDICSRESTGKCDDGDFIIDETFAHETKKIAEKTLLVSPTIPRIPENHLSMSNDNCSPPPSRNDYRSDGSRRRGEEERKDEGQRGERRDNHCENTNNNRRKNRNKKKSNRK